MKRITVAALFTLAGVLGVGTAFAQDHDVRATVPFNFTVGDRVLPAGTYLIAPAMDGAIEIWNTQAKASVLTQAFPDSNRASKGGELVFQEYAGQYFLREILCESAAMNVNLPSTKIEKRARIEEAKLHNHGSQVLIALK
jgi:hypothetical protein